MTGREGLCRAIVMRTIVDIGASDERLRQETEDYIIRGDFRTMVRCAKLPRQLVDAARKAVVRSKADRAELSKRLIDEINSHWS